MHKAWPEKKVGKADASGEDLFLGIYVLCGCPLSAGTCILQLGPGMAG